MNYPQNLSEKDLYWYNLIQKCRTSGKSDTQWLAENNIKSPTFYYHIKQLRKKACKIPDNIYSMRQPETHEVVPVCFDEVPEPLPPTKYLEEPVIPEPSDCAAVKLQIHGISIEITNAATQNTIKNTLAALQGLC